jgi:hypothetical protein
MESKRAENGSKTKAFINDSWVWPVDYLERAQIFVPTVLIIYKPVLWIRKHFLLIRICRFVNMNYGSGSEGQIKYGTGWIRTLSRHVYG